MTSLKPRKIKSIEIVETEEIPVYDICVPITHCFQLGNGCIVHNSKDILDAVIGAYWSAEQAGIDESANTGVADVQNYVKLLQAMKQTRRPMPFRGNF